eukprot:6177195-Pleurochrysis_carterae.AAC.3
MAIRVKVESEEDDFDVLRLAILADETALFLGHGVFSAVGVELILVFTSHGRLASGLLIVSDLSWPGPCPGPPPAAFQCSLS